MTSSDLVLVGSYDYRLVALSVLISILAAYAAHDLAERVTVAHGGARLSWLIGGATASGIGTWSMHYTGMLAFTLPVPVLYDWPTVLVSLLPALFAFTVALFVVSRREIGSLRILGGGVFIGGGIASLHYTAMGAMRLPAMCRYSPALVTLSVVWAIALSLMALWMRFLFRSAAIGRRLRKTASVLLLGAANPVMHYTGMAGTSFIPSGAAPDLSHAAPISSIGIEGITLVPLMVLGVALVTSLVDRLQKHRALLDELFEQAPQAVALMDADNRVVRVNREFTRIFGHTPKETVGRRLDDLIVPEGSQDELERYADSAAHGKRVDAEVVRQRKDGSRLHVSMVRVPVAIPSGQIAVYGIFLDITERKQAEDDLRRSFDQLRALAARLQSVREEERARVAREIHDELGQALTGIKLEAASLIRELPGDGKQQPNRAESIVKLAEETIQAVRRISTELRPGILDDLGLVAAVEWEAGQFEARTGTKCRLDLPKDDIVIDRECATAIFRIFQETLTNVARHAGASQVDVRLARESGNLCLDVRDNGKGISEEQLSAGRSLGILGMRERALLLGGELAISGASGKGTTVRVRIPEAHRR
jgi:PAS domain S-box-containing protein